MSTPVNPRKISWVNPTTGLDAAGNTVAWDAATDMGGIEISFDGTPAVSVPASSAITSFDLTTLAAYTSLSAGQHTIGLAVVTKEGIASAFAPAVTFLSGITPLAPSAVVLA